MSGGLKVVMVCGILAGSVADAGAEESAAEAARDLSLQEAAPDLPIGVGPADLRDMAQPNFDAAEPVVEMGDARTIPPKRRWKVSPHVDLRTTYDDNVFIQNENKTEDVYFTVAPGITLGMWDTSDDFETYLERTKRASRLELPEGNYLVGDYTASILRFLDTTDEDTVEHDAWLLGQWDTGKFAINGEFRYRTGSGADVDIGTRVERRVWLAAAGGRYDFSDRMFVETRFAFEDSQPSGFTGSREWHDETFLNYRATGQVTVGIGWRFGQLMVDDAATERFQQWRARFNYRISDKFSFAASGGVEYRRTSGPQGDETTPVFDTTLTWKPAEGSEIQLAGFREVQNSALEAGRDYVSTGVRLRLRQLVWQRMFAGLEAGYEEADYGDLVQNEDRHDRYYYLRPSLLYNFATWGNAQVAYLYRKNESNLSDFSFTNHQVEFNLSLVF